ncbi:uncharacterized protein LOC129894034 isoform X2 [Solanum dulcamara]|uniref:uncharacterized protein LOC129894034 isoform X2 n=1 Tax=Solanum dulcamara TaxID=45834 RepID=UPI00248631E9|nr:uncharacterized protein LOC129894034 isoform X2 [Solanum dulcamara]
MNSTAMTSTASLSFRPSSLTFERSHSPSLPPSSSSTFFSGGTLLLAHTKFISVSFSSSQYNKKISARRFGRLVVAAADYYSTLGVPKSANSKDIKAAYRSITLMSTRNLMHQKSLKRLKMLMSFTFQVLSDDKKRALYDQYGEAGVKSSVGAQGGAYTTNPFDLFETFFGPSMSGFGMDGAGFGTRRRSTVTKGEDLRYDMTLEFSAAIFGAEKEFELSHLETCEVCVGTGAKVGSKMRICSTCGGRGQVMRTEQTPFGMFSQVSVCPNCGGDGEMISEYCRKCSGEGRTRVKKDIKVKIPPGVNKGSILRVAGEGDAGPRGAPPGDLYVYLDIEEIPEIQRDGINLISTVSVGYLDAILGAVIKVKTVEGMTDLQIPPGTQPGDVLVLARKGAPKLNKPSIRGDHLFTIKVSIPKRISVTERELLEELASLNKGSSTRTKTRPAVQQTAKTTETPVDSSTAAQTDESSEDQDDPLKKLTNFAGSVVNGALKWLRDNL